jgi:LacI family transcriptional regulator
MSVSGTHGPSPAESRAAGMKDVAAAAGVSVGMVSNVLNRPDRVSPATRAKVEDAMADLRFVRNETARHLRVGQSRVLAYVMLDGRNPFFTDVAAGMEDTADAAGLSLFLCNSTNLATREATYLSRLEQQRVQGILITPVDPFSPRLDEIRRRGTPLVVVDRTRNSDSHCSVAVDDVVGGEIAVRHLLELGHERIAFVGGRLDIGQVRERRQGALRALEAAGFGPDHLVDLTTSRMAVATGGNAGRR